MKNSKGISPPLETVHERKYPCPHCGGKVREIFRGPAKVVGKRAQHVEPPFIEFIEDLTRISDTRIGTSPRRPRT